MNRSVSLLTTSLGRLNRRQLPFLHFVIRSVLCGQSLHYIVVFALSQVIPVTNAFFGYRILVFRKKGGGLGDFIRFNMAYLATFVFNVLVLPVE